MGRVKVGELTRTGPRSATIGIGALGLVVLRAPLVLDCVRLAKAIEEASGGPADEAGARPRPVDSDDTICVHAAALGLSLVTRPPGVEDFRAHGRDVLRYGHHVLDELIRSKAIAPGGPDAAGAISEAGSAVLGWVLEVFADDAVRAEPELSGFVPPPAEAAPSGGSA